MLDGSDIAFANALERAIAKVLSGDKDTQGLYQSIRGAQNWDAFNRICGMIQGYETVLAEMRKITRYMNAGGEAERGGGDTIHRPMN
jgi:hypothetical protein